MRNSTNDLFLTIGLNPSLLMLKITARASARLWASHLSPSGFDEMLRCIAEQMMVLKEKGVFEDDVSPRPSHFGALGPTSL
jgi:hypothetical protein